MCNYCGQDPCSYGCPTQGDTVERLHQALTHHHELREAAYALVHELKECTLDSGIILTDRGNARSRWLQLQDVLRHPGVTT